MIKNSIYNLTGGIIRLLISIVSVPLLLQSLGPASFGLYSIANAAILLLSMAEWSIGLTTTVLLSGSYNKYLISSCFYSSVILGFFICGIIFLSSSFIPNLLPSLTPFEIEQVSKLLKIGSLTVWLRVITQFFIGVEQSKDNYSIQNTIVTIYSMFFSLASVVIALYTKSLQLIFLCQLIITLAALVVHFKYTIHHKFIDNINQILAWSMRDVKIVFKHSSRVWPSAFGSALFTQGDKLILGNVLGPSVTGVYSALSSIVIQINSLSALPAQPIVSYIRNRKGENNDNQIMNAVSLNTLISTGMGIVLICFSPEVTSILLGKWVGEYNLRIMLSIMAVVYVVYSHNAVGYYILFATERELLNTVVSICASLLSLVLIYFFARNYGVYGAVVGNVGYWLSLLFLPIGFRLVGLHWKKIYKIYMLSLFALCISSISLYFEMIEARICISLIAIIVILLPNRSTIKDLLLNKNSF